VWRKGGLNEQTFLQTLDAEAGPEMGVLKERKKKPRPKGLEGKRHKKAKGSKKKPI